MTSSETSTQEPPSILGEVISPHAHSEIATLESLQGQIVEERRALFERVFKWIYDPKKKALMKRISDWVDDPESLDLVLSANQITALTREDLEGLEREGVVAIRYNPEHPLGEYALNAVGSHSTFRKLRGSEALRPPKENEVFVLRKALGKTFGLQTQAAQPMNPEQRREAEFEKIPTTAQVLAVCSKNKEEKWEWGPSGVYPDGHHVMPALSAAVQYAQSCFEGLAVMVKENGEVMVFRAEENARRLIQSCHALSIPAPSEEQILKAIYAAVMANKDYLPPAGSSAKMYVRPFVMGLAGGTSAGIGSPDSYVFAVECFPFGEYLAKKETVIRTIASDRQRCLPGDGLVKGAQNYAKTIQELTEAKENRFGNVIYFGEQITEELNEKSEKVRAVRKVLDEASAANVFFISQNEEGKITLHTPPLTRGTILPGITRASVIALAKKLGYEVKEEELTPEDIKGMKGAFLSGTAAGLVRIGSMQLGKDSSSEVAFDKAPENGEGSSAITEAFFRLYDALYAARKGELEPEVFPEMKDWAKKIGQVEAAA